MTAQMQQQPAAAVTRRGLVARAARAVNVHMILVLTVCPEFASTRWSSQWSGTVRLAGRMLPGAAIATPCALVSANGRRHRCAVERHVQDDTHDQDEFLLTPSPLPGSLGRTLEPRMNAVKPTVRLQPPNPAGRQAVRPGKEAVAVRAAVDLHIHPATTATLPRQAAHRAAQQDEDQIQCNESDAHSGTAPPAKRQPIGPSSTLAPRCASFELGPKLHAGAFCASCIFGGGMRSRRPWSASSRLLVSQRRR